ncbi:NADH:flavin oxidoreductase/NADH oxidase [Seiridium cupressi]
MTDMHIAQPLTLPNGLTLPNRLVNAAMAESLADKQGLPSKQTYAPYRAWAKGGWGMVLTGNVQVDSRYLGSPGDASLNETIEYEKMLEVWKTWAKICNSEGTPTLVQINHPGRQSPLGCGDRGFFVKNLAPSAIPMDFGSGLVPKLVNSLVFGTPKEMTQADIDDVVRRFAATARLSAEAGFAGAEIHAAHGYLFAQFLSEKSNQRTDSYGGSPAARAKIVLEVIKAMREATPKEFSIGIKLNSADHQSPQEFSACREQLKLIADAGVDFLEISGGTFENPTMSEGVAKEEKPKTERTEAREAFFLEFANTIRRDLPDVPLMVTGGFRTRQGLEAAVREEGCDLAGIGRPATVHPSLPKEIVFNTEVKDENATFHVKKIQPSWLMAKLGLKFVGAAADTGLALSNAPEGRAAAQQLSFNEIHPETNP